MKYKCIAESIPVQGCTLWTCTLRLLNARSVESDNSSGPPGGDARGRGSRDGPFQPQSQAQGAASPGGVCRLRGPKRTDRKPRKVGQRGHCQSGLTPLPASPPPSTLRGAAHGAALSPSVTYSGLLQLCFAALPAAYPFGCRPARRTAATASPAWHPPVQAIRPARCGLIYVRTRVVKAG